MPTLEYEHRKPRYLPTAEDRAWQIRRVAYYLGQVIVFFLIVYRAGPNLWLFHSPSSPPPSHYAELTKPYVPMIAAIKAYQRDRGRLPPHSELLPRSYRPVEYDAGEGMIIGTTITFGPVEHSVLAYDFSTFSEGWIVYAPRYKGPIPASLVLPATDLPIRPATTRNSYDAE